MLVTLFGFIFLLSAIFLHFEDELESLPHNSSTTVQVIDSIADSATTSSTSGMYRERSAGVSLAGRNSFFYEFSKTAYEKALASSSLVILYFHAGWDADSAKEVEVLREVFDSFIMTTITGFLVHFNDNSTSASLQDFAGRLGVSYQRTKVFIKGGRVLLKSRETWSKERYFEEVRRAL